MTTTTQSQTTSADAHCVRPRIIEEASQGLADLQATAALLCGIRAIAARLLEETTGVEASGCAWSLHELADMATPRLDNAVGGFSDAIMELKRVAPMLAAQANVGGSRHV